MSRRVIAYVRVSRIGGREGDSFLSPELQVEAIERECRRSNLEIIDTLEELDRSGADNTRPLWNEALRRIESGEAQGLVVWNLARFARSVIDGASAIERIEKAGGELYSASGEAGDNSPTGRLTRTIFLAIAEMERDRAAESFAAAQKNAVARGIHIASTVPFGYIRDPESRSYEIDTAASPIVVGMFERRAKGHSWASITRWVIEQGYSTNPQTTETRIKNRAYLGYAYSGSYENRAAHPAIVSRKLFDEANSVRGTKFRGDGKLTSGMLLLGIVRCDNCGRLLSCVASKSRPRKDGGVSSVTPGYYCKNATCKSKGYANAKTLDTWIVGNLFMWLEGLGAADYRVPKSESEDANDADQARESLEVAEYDRKKFIGNRELRRLMSDEEYADELAALTETVNEARIALDMSARKSEVPEIEDVRRLWRTWTNETKREWLGRMVETATVKPKGPWVRQDKIQWQRLQEVGKIRPGSKYSDARWIVECVHVAYSFGVEIGSTQTGIRPSDEVLQKAVAGLGHVPDMLI
jgi:site-specific DNA recombinase